MTGGPWGTLPGMVLAQALSTPDAVAVESAGHRLTYAQLTAHAYGLAEYLRRLGVGPGELIAVAVPRGVELVPALLGVQLAGAAYLPLDPDHPSERLNYVLADAGARVLVTADAAGSPGLRAEVRVPLEDVIVRPAGGVAPELPAASDAAYAIYTSGSTGRPKGVCVTHRGLANVIGSIRELLAFPDGAVLPAVTTVSFDIAALELFLPLTVGGTVVVVPRSDAADPRRLADILTGTGARFLQATPVTWRLLLRAGWSPPPGFTVLCGGERLPAELRDRLTGDGVVLWDLYGPTETTIWSAATRYERNTLPVFHPIAGTSLHLLDERLDPVPADGTGELYLGGTGVADGYLGQSALTAQRFVADPFIITASTRMYRTGDIARKHADGRLEVLGRTDDQVKIRGFRVEPGEIENLLNTHPAVAEAAVRAVEAPGSVFDLVAYVQSANPGGPPSAELLRPYLARSLPSYMVPTQFVVLDELPRTHNGKLDRASLPDPPAPPTSGSIPAGSVQTERRVAETLARLLRREAIDPYDDFFALGGNSMLAIVAVNELNTELHTDLAITALLEVRTAFGLALLIDDETTSSADIAPPSTRTVHDSSHLSPAQHQLWLHQQREPDSTAYNEAITVRLSGAPDVAALHATVMDLLARHDILRTRYERGESGRPEAVVQPTSQVQLELADADPQDVLLCELAEPFNLAAGPPVRIRAVRGGAYELTVLLILHHIAADDRSKELIAGQLRAGYRGRTVPAPAVQYAQYAAWQRETATGPAIQRHLDFWRTTLDRLTPAELRTDRPRTLHKDRHAGTARFTIRPMVASALREIVGARDATVFMGLLAGLHLALARYVTGTDLTVGTHAIGRDAPELSDAIGVFTNTVVTRVNLAGDPSYTEVLDQVRGGTLAAFEHAAAPFQDVVAAVLEASTVRPDPARNPLFDVMFTMQGVPDPGGFPPPDAPGAKVDLSCLVAARADGGFDGRLEYATQLFDEPTVARLARDYVTVLEQVMTRASLLPRRSPDHVTRQRR